MTRQDATKRLPHHVTGFSDDPRPSADIPIESWEYLCRRCGGQLVPPMTAAQAKRFIKKHGARECDPANVLPLKGNQ
jgi:hypothetical protein